MGGGVRQGWARTAAASVAGRSHVSVGRPCEDAWLVVRNQSSEGADVVIACVSDGAGSASHGREGAQLAVAACARWLERAHRAETLGKEPPDAASLVAHVRRWLQRAARTASADVSDYACTLLGVLLGSGGRWSAVHIGDGAIVTGIGGSFELLSGPAKGEFANETFFVTDSDAAENVRLLRGSAENCSRRVESFLLFTDGCEGSLINRRTGEVAPAAPLMMEWFEGRDENAVSEVLSENLREVFTARTHDDCTLVLIKAGTEPDEAAAETAAREAGSSSDPGSEEPAPEVTRHEGVADRPDAAPSETGAPETRPAATEQASSVAPSVDNA